jgi:hypothetical protein
VRPGQYTHKPCDELIDKLREGLRRLEWCISPGFCIDGAGTLIAKPAGCPVCKNLELKGHKPDCWLAALLKEE